MFLLLLDPLPKSKWEVYRRVAVADHEVFRAPVVSIPVSCDLRLTFAKDVRISVEDAGSCRKWGTSMSNQSSFLLEHIQIGASPELNVVLPPKQISVQHALLRLR